MTAVKMTTGIKTKGSFRTQDRNVIIFFCSLQQEQDNKNGAADGGTMRRCRVCSAAVQLYITRDVKYDSEAFKTSSDVDNRSLYRSCEGRLDSNQTSAPFIISNQQLAVQTSPSDQSQNVKPEPTWQKFCQNPNRTQAQPRRDQFSPELRHQQQFSIRTSGPFPQTGKLRDDRCCCRRRMSSYDVKT